MVTRVDEEWDYVRKKGRGYQGTCLKDTLTKPKGARIKGERWGWVRLGGVVGR